MSDSLKTTTDWYNTHAEEYHQKTHAAVNLELIERYCQLIKPGGTVLDAGCASGRDSAYFFKKKFKVVGLDISQSLIDIAKRNHPQIQFLCGDFSQLLFEDNSLDGIFANASLVHVKSLEEFQLIILEFKRVIRVNGILFVSVKQRTKFTEKELFNDPRPYYYFDKEDILTMSNKTGFTVLNLEDSIASRSRGKNVMWIHAFFRKET